MKDCMSLLVILFGRWVGSSDAPYQERELIKIDLDDFEQSSDILQRDIIDRIDLSSLESISDLLDEIARGHHKGIIDNFFSSYLVAVSAPKDQAAFAKHLHTMIQANYAPHK